MRKEKKVTVNTTGKTEVIKLVIPSKWAEYLNISKEEPHVVLELEDGKLIVSKKNVSRETLGGEK